MTKRLSIKSMGLESSSVVPTRNASRVETSTVGPTSIPSTKKEREKKEVAVANVPKLQIQNPAPPPVKRLKTPPPFRIPESAPRQFKSRTYRESEGKPKIESRPSVHLPPQISNFAPQPRSPPLLPSTQLKLATDRSRRRRRKSGDDDEGGGAMDSISGFL